MGDDTRTLHRVTAHLLLHIGNITADPLDEPVKLRHLIPGVFEVIPMPSSCQLQFLDLVFRGRKVMMRQGEKGSWAISVH
jgi:hypothetical protein